MAQSNQNAGLSAMVLSPYSNASNISQLRKQVNYDAFSRYVAGMYTAGKRDGSISKKADLASVLGYRRGTIDSLLDHARNIGEEVTPYKMDEQRIQQLLNDYNTQTGRSVKEIAKDYNISKSYLYRILKKQEQAGKTVNYRRKRVDRTLEESVEGGGNRLGAEIINIGDYTGSSGKPLRRTSFSGRFLYWVVNAAAGVVIAALVFGGSCKGKKEYQEKAPPNDVNVVSTYVEDANEPESKTTYGPNDPNQRLQKAIAKQIKYNEEKEPPNDVNVVSTYVEDANEPESKTTYGPNDPNQQLQGAIEEQIEESKSRDPNAIGVESEPQDPNDLVSLADTWLEPKEGGTFVDYLNELRTAHPDDAWGNLGNAVLDLTEGAHQKVGDKVKPNGRKGFLEALVVNNAETLDSGIRDIAAGVGIYENPNDKPPKGIKRIGYGVTRIGRGVIGSFFGVLKNTLWDAPGALVRAGNDGVQAAVDVPEGYFAGRPEYENKGLKLLGEAVNNEFNTLDRGLKNIGTGIGVYTPPGETRPEGIEGLGYGLGKIAEGVLVDVGLGTLSNTLDGIGALVVTGDEVIQEVVDVPMETIVGDENRYQFSQDVAAPFEIVLQFIADNGLGGTGSNRVLSIDPKEGEGGLPFAYYLTYGRDGRVSFVPNELRDPNEVFNGKAAINDNVDAMNMSRRIAETIAVPVLVCKGYDGMFGGDGHDKRVIQEQPPGPQPGSGTPPGPTAGLK